MQILCHAERRPIHKDVAPILRVAPDIRYRLVRLRIHCLRNQPPNNRVREFASIELEDAREVVGERTVEVSEATTGWVIHFDLVSADQC